VLKKQFGMPSPFGHGIEQGRSMKWLLVGVVALVLLWLALFLLIRYLPGLETEYARRFRSALADAPSPSTNPLTEAHITHLPAPVQRYLRITGAMGKPPVQNMQLRFDAEMFQKPDQAGMRGPVQQFNTVHRLRRLFFMRTTMFALPVMVLHDHYDIHASMTVRLASLINVVDLHSDTLARTETVTVLNDICFFAPSNLVDPRLTWQAFEDTRARVTFTNGPHQVSAELVFNDAGELVNFISNDRSALQRDGSLRLVRWSTPMRDYREFEGRRVPTAGEAIWHYPEGDFVYGRMVLKEIRFNVSADSAFTLP
jgi:hypothetical protein